MADIIYLQVNPLPERLFEYEPRSFDRGFILFERIQDGYAL